jgi:hypothetical protein
VALRTKAGYGLLILHHTQRRTIVGRTPLNEWFPTWGSITSGVRNRTFRGTRKKFNNGGRRPFLGYLFTVNTYKFEIIATILITSILLIWGVKFMERVCQGAHKWQKFGNHCSRRVISPTKVPLTESTQHTQKISMPPGAIRSCSLSRRAASGLRLRPRSHWDWQAVHTPRDIWGCNCRVVETRFEKTTILLWR